MVKLLCLMKPVYYKKHGDFIKSLDRGRLKIPLDPDFQWIR